MEFLNVRQAAEEAGVLSAYIYISIGEGLLEVHREGRRVFIPRPAFNAWKRRLDANRKLRAEAKRLRAAHGD